MGRKLATLLAISISIAAAAQPAWPPVTATTKPWTRWWWEGSAVDKKNLTWNLEQYRSAGLGGVEITPIYGVEGQEARFLSFLSPKWMEALRHTLDEGARLGLGVDLANATGWPFGGPWVRDADASKTVYVKTYTVQGGAPLSELIRYRREALVRTANTKTVSADSLLQPVAANKDLQALALDQVQYAGELPLQTLMAYGPNGAVLNLTTKVNAGGKLDWTPPAGNWTLYALFQGLHGKMVERAAPGGEGYAIDHFSEEASRNYFAHFDSAFRGHSLKGLRAFFNDSYEVDDARGQANWTPKFFDEFQQRRGYDLRRHLPLLFGKGGSDSATRVLYDYRATIDELLLQHFTEQWKRWGSRYGAKVRNQSHGSPANTLDLYNAVDIPETEGEDVLRFKFASSAANVSGKPLVSSESATWLNEHFLSSWSDVKKAIDLYFLGGINHIFYHGTTYSPQDAPWPGWLFYAAVQFVPSNPQWKDFGALNQYITRVQSFLQQGRPDNDVLLYYPIVDRYSTPGNNLLQHFDGMKGNFAGTAFEKVSEQMLESGYSFDFFSDRQLQRFAVSGNTIHTGGNEYRAILLPASRLMDVASVEKLLALARAGARVLVYKDLPSDVPGLNDLDKRRTAFRSLLAQLAFNSESSGLRKASLGKGAFYIGDDLDALLAAGNVRHERIAEAGLSFVRRRNNRGTLYFLNNRSDKPVEGWVQLQTKAATMFFFEPASGLIRGAAWRVNPATGIPEVRVQLRPWQSILVQAYNKVQKGFAWSYEKEGGTAQPLTGSWSVQFVSGGPTLPQPVTRTQLGSWTDWGSEELQNFSGSARYSITFAKPSGQASAWRIDLGKVHETAEVFLNGKKLETLIGPEYRITVRPEDLQASNKLEVVVSNLMANRIRYMDQHNIPWKTFYNINMAARKKENLKNGIFDASGWQSQPSGLLGPVTLTPINYQ
jgi:hypothetical protein